MFKFSAGPTTMTTNTMTMTVTVMATAMLVCMVSTVGGQLAQSLDACDPTLALSKYLDPLFCESLKGKYPNKYLSKAIPGRDLAKHRLLAGKLLARQLKSLSSGTYDRRNVLEQPMLMMMPRCVRQQQQHIQPHRLPQTMANFQTPFDIKIMRALAQTDGSRMANEPWGQRCTCRPPVSFSTASVVPHQMGLSHGATCSYPCHPGL